jgi:hypothetical protein
MLPIKNVFQTRCLCIITSQKQTRGPPDGGKSRPDIVDPYKLHLCICPTHTRMSYLDIMKVTLMGIPTLTVIEANTATTLFFADAPLLLNTTGGRGLKTAVSSDDESTPPAAGEQTSPFGDVFGEKKSQHF